jgi:RNA polymerase sigma factor for flagellar operon FliA
VNSDEGTVERLDTVASPHRRLEPETAAELQQAKVRFREAFERLPTRQREIAVLLYVKNLSLKEIGEIYGLSESRVSQIHAQMRRKLRKLLAAEEELLQAVM